MGHEEVQAYRQVGLQMSNSLNELEGHSPKDKNIQGLHQRPMIFCKVKASEKGAESTDFTLRCKHGHDVSTKE